MKRLSGNTRKQQDEPSEKQIEFFNIYFITIGQILIENYMTPEKMEDKKEL